MWVRGFLSFRRRRQRARSTMYSILWPAAEQHHFHVQLPRVLRAPGMLSILHAQRGDGCRTRRLALSLVFGHSQPCPRTAHGIMTNDEMEPRYSESGLGHRESHARENETIMLFAGGLAREDPRWAVACAWRLRSGSPLATSRRGLSARARLVAVAQAVLRSLARSCTRVLRG